MFGIRSRVRRGVLRYLTNEGNGTMDARVVQLRPAPEPVDPSTLPDPAPYVLAEVRDLVDRICLSHAEIAARVNQVCRTTWVDEYVIGLWYAGDGDVCARQRLALAWLAGDEAPPAAPQPTT